MKKSKIILSVVVAAVLVMAMAVTAFAVAPGVSISNKSPKAGDTVTFTVTCPDEGMQADVTVSNNLTFVSNTGMFSKQNKVIIVGKNDTVTYTYKVKADAAANSKIEFSLSNVVLNDGGPNDIPGDPASVSGTVTAPVAPPTQEPTQPTNPPATQEPTQPTQNPTTNPTSTSSASATSSSNLDKVPKTGDTTTDLFVLAVIAIAAAGTIGVVACKKAFSK